MRPAFSSTGQAGAFALLLLVSLLLPVMMGSSLMSAREQVYASLWSANGDYQFIEQEIFHEKSDLDILFIGSSHIACGIDTPYVEEQLSRRQGHPAKVRSFVWGGAGSDHLYFIARDLLERRKVKVLVFDGDYNPQNQPQNYAPRWFCFGDRSGNLEGLSWRLKVIFYFGAVMGMPRSIFSLLNQPLPADEESNKRTHWAISTRTLNPMDRLGSIPSLLGFAEDPSLEHGPFSKFKPRTNVQASSARVYAPATKANFDFSGPDLPPLQLNFFRKLGRLAQQHDCKLVMIHVPVLDERYSDVI